MTHTYALMEVSDSAWAEIHEKLLEAGYRHEINEEGEIDMHGIALVRTKREPADPPEFYLRLKDQHDDTYVFCIEEKGKQRGVYVGINLKRDKGNPFGIVASLLNVVHTLAKIMDESYRVEDGKLVFVLDKS